MRQRECCITVVSVVCCLAGEAARFVGDLGGLEREGDLRITVDVNRAEALLLAFRPLGVVQLKSAVVRAAFAKARRSQNHQKPQKHTPHTTDAQPNTSPTSRHGHPH